MADLASSLSKMNDLEVSSEAPLTEALHAKVGGSTNALIDFANANAPVIAALAARRFVEVIEVNLNAASGNPLYTVPANRMLFGEVFTTGSVGLVVAGSAVFTNTSPNANWRSITATPGQTITISAPSSATIRLRALLINI